MTSDAREQFERHFAMPEWMKKRDAMGEYLDEFAQLRWEGWQAAMTKMAEQKPVAWMEFDMEGNQLGATWEPDGTWPTRPLIFGSKPNNDG